MAAFNFAVHLTETLSPDYCENFRKTIINEVKKIIEDEKFKQSSRSEDGGNGSSGNRKITFIHLIVLFETDKEVILELPTVQQDFFAGIFMMTLSATLAFPVDEKLRAESQNSDRKYSNKVNRTNALAMTKEKISL